MFSTGNAKIALYHWTCLNVKHGEGTHIEGQPYEAQGGPVDVH